MDHSVYYQSWAFGVCQSWRAAPSAAAPTAQHTRYDGGNQQTFRNDWKIGGRIDWLAKSAVAPSAQTAIYNHLQANRNPIGALDRFGILGAIIDWGVVAGVEIPPRPGPQPGGGDSRREWLELRGQIIREDREIIELIAALIDSKIIH